MSRASSLQHDTVRPVNAVALATETEGYSATDLRDLVARAVHQAAVRSAEAIAATGSKESFNTTGTLVGQEMNTYGDVSSRVSNEMVNQ
jgi:hypothetical protein